MNNVLLIRKVSKQIPIYQMNLGISSNSKMADTSLSKANLSAFSKVRCLAFGKAPSSVLLKQCRAPIAHCLCILHFIPYGAVDVVNSNPSQNHA